MWLRRFQQRNFFNLEAGAEMTVNCRCENRVDPLLFIRQFDETGPLFGRTVRE